MIDVKDDYVVITAGASTVILDAGGWQVLTRWHGFIRNSWHQNVIADVLRGGGMKRPEQVVARVSREFAEKHQLTGTPRQWYRRRFPLGYLD